MACAISRNSRLRCIYRSLSSNYRLFSRSGSTSSSSSTPSNPQLQPFHNKTLEIVRNQSKLFSPVDCQWGKYGVLPFLTLNHRFHCTTTTNVNQATISDASSRASSSSGTSESSSSKSSSNSGTSESSSSKASSNSGKSESSSSKASSNSGTSESSGDGSQKTGEQGKPIRGSPVSWMSFFLLLVTGATLIWYYDREKKRHIEGINSASKTVKQWPSAGKAAIGGPFSLVDHNGKSVTEKDFFGKWNLMYFGFTHCPDICPDELQKLAAAVDKIKEKSGIQVVPVFISVDPERDTVEQVHEYVKEFHPNLIGLTGSVDEVKKAARAYRVYYMKTEEEGSDYLVDHSIVMYLMDPNMGFVKFFGKNHDADSLADGVIKEIKQRK